MASTASLYVRLVKCFLITAMALRAVKAHKVQKLLRRWMPGTRLRGPAPDRPVPDTIMRSRPWSTAASPTRFHT